jgi:hypothetical protein
MNTNSQHWTSLVTKAAVTLLIAALVAYAAWWLLRQLIAPIVILFALIGIYRLALGMVRRDRW